MFAKTFCAASLLSYITSVVAIGSAVVENNCAFPVYLWSVSSVSGPEVVIPAGQKYSEEYYNNSNGGGISVKMAADSSAATITQFEYTLDGTSLWYDVSNINGYPFESWGLTLVPSDPTCASVTCDPGVAKCEDVYNLSNDDAATHECGSSANMVMVLCSGNVAQASAIASKGVAAATSVVAAVAPTLVEAEKVAITSTTSTTAAPVVASTQAPAPVVAPSTTLVTHTKAAATSTSTTPAVVAAPATTSTTPAVVAAPATTAAPAPVETSAGDVVLTTTYTTIYVTEGDVVQTSSSLVVTTPAPAATTSAAPVEAVATPTSTKKDHFNWPAFTGFPGAKVRRGHQHFHAHAHGAGHHHA